MKKIDYNKPITREHLDIKGYNKKFVDVDAWLSSDRKDTLKYGNFLHDPTKFAYLHQRIDGKKLKYYPYQDMIANDPYRFKFFRAANQIGKSLFLDSKAARNLIWDHGHAHNEAIVSKSLPQSTFQMRRVKSLLNTMPEISWKEEKGTTDSMSVISADIKEDILDNKGKPNGKTKIKYTNLLICAPCTEGLLGYDLHELNLDEYEFWDVDLEHFMNQIAEPRTYGTHVDTGKGNITIFSNPNGADSYGATLENIVLPNGIKKYHVYVFNFMDRPGNTQEMLEMAEAGKARQVIESTLLAIRSLSDRNYFSRDEINGSYDKSLNEFSMVDKQTFWFLDVGAKHDQSVLVGGYIEPDQYNDKLNHIHIPIIQCYPVGYPLTKVVGAKNTTEDGWHYVKSVKEYLEEYSKDGSQPVFGVDVTGNTGISPLFDSIGIHPVDITFSGPVKSGMYQRLKYFMEKSLLHRIKSEEFDYQFAHLEMKKSARGYLMIHHESEKDLDDVPDSVAGLVHLADGPVIKTTLTII